MFCTDRTSAKAETNTRLWSRSDRATPSRGSTCSRRCSRGAGADESDASSYGPCCDIVSVEIWWTSFTFLVYLDILSSVFWFLKKIECLWLRCWKTYFLFYAFVSGDLSRLRKSRWFSADRKSSVRFKSHFLSAKFTLQDILCNLT